MKTVLKIVYKVFAIISIVMLVLFAAVSIYGMPTAFDVIVTKNVRLKYIERNLNKIPNVEVVQISGDIHMFAQEYIMATIKINDKDCVSFFDIDKDVFDNIDTIRISSVNGYSFIQCEKDKMKYGIDMGTNTVVGKSLGLTINTIEDIVDNIDVIGDMVDNMSHFPHPNYFYTDSKECYIIRMDTEPFYQNSLKFLEDYQSKIAGNHEDGI